MTYGRTSLIASAFLLLLCLAAPALAQDAALPIDFEFVAGGKVLPAGSYTVTAAPAGGVTITPSPSGTAVDVAPIKPKNDKQVGRSELVFEQVGSKWFLIEVSIAGQGKFVVGKTVEPQGRRSVKAPKAK